MRSPGTSNAEQGFTLIEILIVLVLVSSLVSVAVFSMAGSLGQRKLDQFAHDLHLQMETAREYAVFENEEIGLRIQDGRFEFLKLSREAESWEPATDRRLRDQSAPESIKVLHERRAGLPLLTDEDSGHRPDVIFLSSGEVTGFTLTLSDESGTSAYEITSSGGMPIRLQQTQGRGG
ncbi:type II secretion system minor pseudopilin GspH [Marinobacter oulmenensis]|uniref:type II secretion system minor pseudopilin GspH n=1 Tax=Marinobacter oulmenensis TaxID=643747 RepID=UPI00248453CE|nr:type II secretion system minor pseudopilin GspH [Marinobacter oulmenensis]